MLKTKHFELKKVFSTWIAIKQNKIIDLDFINEVNPDFVYNNNEYIMDDGSCYFDGKLLIVKTGKVKNLKFFTEIGSKTHCEGYQTEEERNKAFEHFKEVIEDFEDFLFQNDI